MKTKIIIILLLFISNFVYSQGIPYNTFGVIKTANPWDGRDSLTTLADTANMDPLFMYPGIESWVRDVGQKWLYNGTKWVFLYDSNGLSSNIAQDTSIRPTYLAGHNYTDGVLYAIKADFTRASAEFADSIHTTFIVGAPDPDSVYIQYAGTYTQIAHGYAVGKLYFLTDSTAVQFDTLNGTISRTFSDPAFVVIDEDHLELLNQGVDINTTINRRVIPSPFITAYGGDPLNPTDSVIQAVVEGIYVPTGRATPGTIFLTQFAGASKNPAHQASSNSPSTPSNLFYWDGRLITGGFHNQKAISLQDTAYGSLYTLSLDTVQLIDGIPTDSTVANWLEINYSNNNLRLYNGTLLYWGGNKITADYIWQIVDDLTPLTTGDSWDAMFKRIKSPTPNLMASNVTFVPDSTRFISTNLQDLGEEISALFNTGIESNTWYVQEQGLTTGAIKGDPNYPLNSPWAARDSAVAGDVIYIKKGDYRVGPVGSGALREVALGDYEDSAINKDSVLVYLDQGAVVGNIGLEIKPIIYDTTGQLITIVGPGSIRNEDARAYIGILDNADSRLTVKVGEIYNSENGISWGYGFRLYQFEVFDVSTDLTTVDNSRFINFIEPDTITPRLSFKTEELYIPVTSDEIFRIEPGILKGGSINLELGNVTGKFRYPWLFMTPAGSDFTANVNIKSGYMPDNGTGNWKTYAITGGNNSKLTQNSVITIHCDNCYTESTAINLGRFNNAGNINNIVKVTGTWRSSALRSALTVSTTRNSIDIFDGLFISETMPVLFKNQTWNPTLTGEFRTLADTSVIVNTTAAGEIKLSHAELIQGGNTNPIITSTVAEDIKVSSAFAEDLTSPNVTFSRTPEYGLVIPEPTLQRVGVYGDSIGIVGSNAILDRTSNFITYDGPELFENSSFEEEESINEWWGSPAGWTISGDGTALTTDEPDGLAQPVELEEGMYLLRMLYKTTDYVEFEADVPGYLDIINPVVTEAGDNLVVDQFFYVSADNAGSNNIGMYVYPNDTCIVYNLSLRKVTALFQTDKNSGEVYQAKDDSETTILKSNRNIASIYKSTGLEYGKQLFVFSLSDYFRNSSGANLINRDFRSEFWQVTRKGQDYATSVNMSVGLGYNYFGSEEDYFAVTGQLGATKLPLLQIDYPTALDEDNILLYEKYRLPNALPDANQIMYWPTPTTPAFIDLVNVGTWLKPELEEGNDVNIDADESQFVINSSNGYIFQYANGFEIEYVGTDGSAAAFAVSSEGVTGQAYLACEDEEGNATEINSQSTRASLSANNNDPSFYYISVNTEQGPDDPAYGCINLGYTEEGEDPYSYLAAYNGGIYLYDNSYVLPNEIPAENQIIYWPTPESPEFIDLPASGNSLYTADDTIPDGRTVTMEGAFVINRATGDEALSFDGTSEGGWYMADDSGESLSLNNGQIKGSAYGTGSITGTAATYPAFDATGRIIESATPYGGGENIGNANLTTTGPRTLSTGSNTFYVDGTAAIRIGDVSGDGNSTQILVDDDNTNIYVLSDIVGIESVTTTIDAEVIGITSTDVIDIIATGEIQLGSDVLTLDQTTSVDITTPTIQATIDDLNIVLNSSGGIRLNQDSFSIINTNTGDRLSILDRFTYYNSNTDLNFILNEGIELTKVGGLSLIVDDGEFSYGGNAGGNIDVSGTAFNVNSIWNGIFGVGDTTSSNYGTRFSGTDESGAWEYRFPTSSPSFTSGDTTIMAWLGTGSAATPLGFIPLPAGGGSVGVDTVNLMTELPLGDIAISAPASDLAVDLAQVQWRPTLFGRFGVSGSAEFTVSPGAGFINVFASDGMTFDVTNGSGSISFLDSIGVNNQRIYDLGPGISATDAINKNQLDNLAAEIETASVSDTTDGSGEITVSHGLGTAAVSVVVTVTGSTPYFVTVTDKTTTDFTVAFYNIAGTLVTSTGVTFDYIVKLQ